MNDFVCHILLSIGCVCMGIKGENVNLQAFLTDYKIHDTWHTQYSSELYTDMKQDFSANFCYYLM